MGKPGKRQRERNRRKREVEAEPTTPDWTRECAVCGSTPILPYTGMCGPCTFGEAETAGGNW